MSLYFYETARGHTLPHDPIKAIVAPRPIGWISTVNAEGQPNLAPYSFFNMVCGEPPIVAFSSSGFKHSVANAEKTGEFVVNVATFALKDAVNLSSAPVPVAINEFELTGLETAPSRIVKAPRVARSPAALECKVLNIRELHDLDGKGTDSFLVLGQVVAVHMDEAFLNNGRFDTAAAEIITRCGYMDYAVTREMFTLERPKT